MPIWTVHPATRELRDEAGALVGAALDVNPLATDAPSLEAAIAAAPGSYALLWSGWADERSGPVCARDIRNWRPEAWDALVALLDRLAASKLGKTILFRPHARHVLSDTQRCVKLFHAVERPGVGAAIDVGALLEPGMLDAAEDHLSRAVSVLPLLAPSAAALLLSNVTLVEDGDGEDAFAPAPVEEGLLSAQRLSVAARAWDGLTILLTADPAAARFSLGL